MSEGKIYFAAGLFNGPDNLFNLRLTERLEVKGYEVNLPQRDGFEFSSLSEKLEEGLDKKEVGRAMNSIIYFYDNGFFIPNSDVVLARFDEPSDEGVIEEINNAKSMDKPVVGYRTDVRSPYGDLSDDFRGMHFFLPFGNCDYFIKENVSGSSKEDKGFGNLVNKIDECINEIDFSKFSKKSYNNKTKWVRKGAELLFGNVNNIKSNEGINKIVENYKKNKDYLMRTEIR